MNAASRAADAAWHHGQRDSSSLQAIALGLLLSFWSTRLLVSMNAENIPRAEEIGVQPGVLLFTDRVEHVVPPRKGRRHALRLIRDMLAFEPAGHGTDVAGASDYLLKSLSHKAIIFLVSDFLQPALERPLKLLAQRHDLVAVTVEDPAEAALPDVGLARFIDPESREVVDVDTSDPQVRRAFAEAVDVEREARRRLFRRLAVDEIAVRTDQPVIEPLLKFFRTRETTARRR